MSVCAGEIKTAWWLKDVDHTITSASELKRFLTFSPLPGEIHTSAGMHTSIGEPMEAKCLSCQQMAWHKPYQ